nr:unnamed protein product [Digitaria exilis]
MVLGTEARQLGQLGDVNGRSRSVHGEAPAKNVVPRVEGACCRREAHTSHIGEHRGGVGSHGHIDPLVLAVVVHPHLHRLSARERQVPEDAAAVIIVVAGAGRGHGHEAVNVDADVVAVDVAELVVLVGVELDAEEVVAGVAVGTSWR